MFVHALLLAAATLPAFAPPPTTHASASAGEAGVAWFEDGFNMAVREAAKRDTLVLIALAPDWSGYSNKLIDETFADERVAAAVGDIVCLKFRVEDSNFQQVRKMFNVEDFPAIVFANGKGRIEDLISGFIPPEPLLEQLERVKRGEGTVGWHRNKVAEAPDDLEQQYNLYSMLLNVSSHREADKVLAGIRTADPKGETRTGARLIFDDVWDEVKERGGDDPADWDLTPVHEHLSKVKLPAARVDGWNRVGNFHASAGHMGASFDAFMNSWNDISEDGALDFGSSVAWFIMENDEGKLEQRHKDFALHLADRVATLATKARDEYVAEHGTPTSEDGGDYDKWLAGKLDLLVWCQFNYGTSAEATEKALAACRRCIELDPENEEYQGRLAMLLERA